MILSAWGTDQPSSISKSSKENKLSDVIRITQPINNRVYRCLLSTNQFFVIISAHQIIDLTFITDLDLYHPSFAIGV